MKQLTKLVEDVYFIGTVFNNSHEFAEVES